MVRECFELNGHKVEGRFFYAELLKATCGLEKKIRLDVMDKIITLSSRTAWGGDSYLLLRSLFLCELCLNICCMIFNMLQSTSKTKT